MGSDSVVSPNELDFVGDFDSQVNHVLQTIRLTRQEVDDFRRLFIDLERCLQRIWLGCKVMPFGSVVTGLGIKSSDVDCYVFIPEEHNNYEQDQADLVLSAKKVLRRQPLVFHQPFAITNAKVPIVKFCHVPTRRNCDVSFKSPAGVRNSKLIAFLLHLDKRAQPLAILIKYWANIHGLTGTNRMSNYALTMLVLFYLQEKKIIPAVVKLQSPNNSFYVEGWNTDFKEKYIHQTENNQVLYELLGEFFQFYSSFNFKDNVISPFLGQSVRRELFKDIENTPNDFEVYKKNVYNKQVALLKIDTMICVQDPFEHNRNCTSAISSKLAETIQLHIEFASNIYHENKSKEFLKDILTKKPIISINKKKKKNKASKNEAPPIWVIGSNNENHKSISSPTNMEVPDAETCAGTSNVDDDIINHSDEINSETNNTPDSNLEPAVVVPSNSKRSLNTNLTNLYMLIKKQKKK